MPEGEHHLTPEEKREREKIVKALKHKKGIDNPYAVATSAAKKVTEERLGK